MSFQRLFQSEVRPSGAVRGWRLEVPTPALLTLCAVALWAIGLGDVNIRQMTDLGLITVLPPPVFLGLIVLTVSFCLTLHRRAESMPLLFLHLVALVIMLYGITALVEDVPRFQSAWRHVGIIDVVMRTSNVDPRIDAYFNWPGFFIFSAFVTEISGFDSAISFLAWAPVFFNLLALGPLVMIFRSTTGDRRLIWLGAWFYYLTNWIGQDYFSPQALTYFFYLVILAILVKWFKLAPAGVNPVASGRHGAGALARLRRLIAGWLARADTPGTPSQSGQRIALLGIVITLFVAAVPSHQLTPFAILASVTALVAFNRCTARGLPVLMAVLIGSWISYMTLAYLGGHLRQLTQHVGEVNATVGANVTERLQGSPEHLLVIRMRFAMTIALWGLAVLGGLRRWYRGSWDLTCALLAGAPFPLLGLQSYGGELLLRVYLYTLPFMVFFAAALFYTTPATGTSWRTPLMIGLVSMTFAGSFFITRYGNERMDAFSAAEVAAVEHLYDIATPNSLLLAGSHNTPWKFQGYEQYRYLPLTEVLDTRALREPASLEREVDVLAQLMADQRYPGAYLIITRTQKAQAEMFGVLPPGALDRLEQALMASPRFRVLYANDDAMIFALAHAALSGGVDGAQR